ncbi:VOC family protein [Serratia entomophila]|uniref:VOC family protein n=1 Tax=Serratia entomophila TaxID=42906 RepID=UPI00217B88C8|nr:VOC family protein [Serratia entomophila]CAI1075259.1 Metallothiol transferase fosB [Serratia entomophila]CAI1118160.1 Metallothiol transferase fosB [Serratia entomophila]CAI1121202.1 Metallothiol transferase fosB [Serratia entomophila]CAI1124573.1 Metallothiol transferase fosB [Serratia entomophila]CAI1912679.1 Metallothiol transferase fosB [Serratia entomophila]
MRPFSLKKIDHIVLRVCDLEKSIQFYTQILGCEIARRRPDLGLVHLRAGVSMIDLVDVDGVLGKKGGMHPDARQQNVDHFCLRIEPFNEGELLAYLQAQGLGAAPAESRYGAEGDGPSIYFTDPDGNHVELKGPAAQA